MRPSSLVPPGSSRRAAILVFALLPAVAEAAPPTTPDDPATAPAEPTTPEDPPPPSDAPPVDAPPIDAPPIEAPPVDAPPVDAPPVETGETVPEAPAPTTNAAPADDLPAKPKKKKTTTKKKKKKKKPAEKHKVNQGTDYRLALYPGGYVQGPAVSVGAQAGIRQTLEPKKNHRIVLGLDYAYEPFSTRTLGFPEEDEAQGGLNRTLVQPIHILEGRASRRMVWNKLVTTTLDLYGDAWWPSKTQHQRWSMRLTPGLRVGKSTGLFGAVETELFYKKFPNYFIATRRIDQEGAISTARIGYDFRKRARVAAGFTFDFTHYLDSHYDALAPDGTFVRSNESKNYLDTIPFAEFQVRPVKGLRIQGRYAFERQKTQHYNRVMTGRDEFASLTPYFFRGYYDYRRHRATLGISWSFRNRLRVSGMVEAWVRHFDVYEARDVDNFWTGQLRLDAEIEASLEAAVRVYTLKHRQREHDFFISLLGAHVSRTSNMKHEISLATNFDITRVFLGFEVRGH